MDLYKRNRLLFFVILYAAISVVLIVVAILYNLRGQYDNQLEISNLSQYTDGQPSDTDSVEYIKYALFNTVSHNVDYELKNDSIKDILIRDRTFSQVYDKSTQLYMVHFIVDIKSLKQSYRVAYEWSSEDQFSEHISEYGTQISCLPPGELVYGSFDCVDDRILEQGKENYDAISPLLPYHVKSKYKVAEYEKITVGEEKGRVILTVDVYANRGDIRPSTQAINEYSEEIKAWLVENKLNVNNYTLTFRY